MISPKVVAIGECMIEVIDRGAASAGLGFGGDTLNTAVYLARLGVDIEYLTALGRDPLSEQMLASWRSEGIAVDRVLQVDGELPGLYLIRTTAEGERSFLYWRENSPARRLLELPHTTDLLPAFAEADWLYFSGITLSIMSDVGRLRLLKLLMSARARGAKIVFDSNYRPRAWPSAMMAKAAFELFLNYVDIALPSFDDERVLYGDASPMQTAERMHGMGVSEVVVKNSREGCFVSTAQGRQHLPVALANPVIDTTAAGDSFNAAYLASRLWGLSPVQSAAHGHQLAAVVIQHRGALIPRAAMPIIFETGRLLS